MARRNPYSRRAMNKAIRENEAEDWRKYPELMWGIYIVGFIVLIIVFAVTHCSSHNVYYVKYGIV
ncbi:hypothetical protein VST7929_01353 [Vibrio stylophorae]|uniref:Uncharacterized protein n=1 Tax=Vibrio stylophorae TaxID=659351 RepID=A0ABM8ZT58_9VIBR|nr:hypothetical protein VST7929_01353 [Vibrio stylophorae]